MDRIGSWRLARLLRLLARRYGHINWALADQALVSGASFATAVLIARVLGVEEFGRFSLAWLSVFLVQTIQIALITAPMMTIGAKLSPDEQPQYRGAVLIQQGLFAVLSTGLIYLAAKASGSIVPDWRLDALAVPIAAVIAFGGCQDFLRRYFYAVHKEHISFAIDIVRYVGQIAALIVLFYWFAESTALDAAFWAISLTAFAGTVLGAIFFCSSRFSWRALRRITARHWTFSRWLLGSALAEWLREHFVSTAVGALLGLTEVGVYRAAQQLVTVVNIPLQGLGNLVPMRAARAYGDGGLDALLGFMKRFVLKYMLAIAGVLIVIAALGNWLLTRVYGMAFDGYGYIVSAMATIMLIYVLREMVSIMVRAAEVTRSEFLANLAGALFVLSASYALIGTFGIVGALVCEAVSMSIVCLVIALWFRRTMTQRHAKRTAEAMAAGVEKKR